MNVKRLSLVTGFVALWTGACMAASQGVIQFSGSIVEASCATNARSGSVMELRGCAQSSRGSRIEVRSVAPVASVDAPHVRLVADSGEGRYYDQRYVLVDRAGKLIQSGNYIITMTSP